MSGIVDTRVTGRLVAWLLAATLVAGGALVAACAQDDAGDPADAPAAGAEEPDADAVEDLSQGETLIRDRCTGHHTAERIAAADKDRAGWEATVDRMIGKGAQLTGQEREALIDHLADE